MFSYSVRKAGQIEDQIGRRVPGRQFGRCADRAPAAKASGGGAPDDAMPNGRDPLFHRMRREDASSRALRLAPPRPVHVTRGAGASKSGRRPGESVTESHVVA
jgi:hypothetical protein